MATEIFGPFLDEEQFGNFKRAREREAPPARVEKLVQGGQIFARVVPLAAGAAAAPMEAPVDAPVTESMAAAIGGAPNLGDHDLDILTRTLWGEARGEPEAGQIAVVHVIRNRATRRNTSVATECQQEDQFTCWFDARAPRLRALATTDPAYQQLAMTARRAWGLPDRTGGACHYYAPMGMPGGGAPSWAAQGRETLRIGRHIFFTDVP